MKTKYNLPWLQVSCFNISSSLFNATWLMTDSSGLTTISGKQSVNRVKYRTVRVSGLSAVVATCVNSLVRNVTNVSNRPIGQFSTNSLLVIARHTSKLSSQFLIVAVSLKWWRRFKTWTKSKVVVDTQAAAESVHQSREQGAGWGQMIGRLRSDQSESSERKQDWSESSEATNLMIAERNFWIAVFKQNMEYILMKMTNIYKQNVLGQLRSHIKTCLFSKHASVSH